MYVGGNKGRQTKALTRKVEKSSKSRINSQTYSNVDYSESESMNSFLVKSESPRFPLKIKVESDSASNVSLETIKIPQVVQIRGEITEATAEEFATAFHQAENNGQDLIPIVIDSFGGDVYAMLSMVDIIKNSTIPVATIVVGKAMSAGAVLLSCGAEGMRFASPNSTIMIHSAWETGISGNAEEVRVNANELMRINKKILEIMSKNCGHHKDYFYNIMTENKNTDWFLNPKEAQKHKIINSVKIPEYKIRVSTEISFK